MAQPTELYVYYRVRRSAGAVAHAEIEALQAQLRQRWPGLQTRLLARAEAAGDSPGDAADPTWMEIYRCPGGCDDAALADVIAAGAALPGARLGPRIVEPFLPLGLGSS